MRNAVVSMLATLCLVSTPVLAEEMEHSESGLQFELPKGWKHEQEDDVLVATSPNGKVEVAFIVSEVDDAEELTKAMADELDELIKDVEVSQEPKDEEVNGLTQIYAEGNGKCDGKPCDWDLTLVVGAKKSLLVVAVGDIEKNQGTITKLYQSIKVAEEEEAVAEDAK